MKGIAPLFLGIFAALALSWVGLILVPNAQIGHLEPQVDEEGNDPYPAPKSGMADRGRRIYASSGCVYCHSQQIRGDYAASDLERQRDQGPTPKAKWADRRSAPRDYIFERPVLLGKMRLGPDLANIGKAAPVEKEEAPSVGSPAPTTPGQAGAQAAANPPATGSPAASPAKAVAAGAPAPGGSSPAANPPPIQAAEASPGGTPPLYSAAWHHRHLYSPRSLIFDSNMPAYHFLYEKRRIGGQRAADAVELSGGDGVQKGWEVVPTYDARCLVAYLMSLDQSHPLQELKAPGGGAVAPSAPASSAPSPAKEAK